jgi:uncharacterized membrane protein
MTLIEAVRLAWLLTGLIAVVFAVRKLRRANADHAAHKAENGNGAVRYAGRWRIQQALFALVMAGGLAGAASLAVANWIIGAPTMLGLWALIVLTIVPVVFAFSLVSDDRNHQRLLDLISTEGELERRKMDDHIVTERAE